jgi:hypothetical protein
MVSQLIVQLPVIGVLVAGFALIPSRRGRIGARRANLAMAGLLVLALEFVVSIAWSGLGTLLIMNRTIETSHFGVLASVLGFFLAVLTATAVALLLAAAVSSAPHPSGPPPPAPFEPAGPHSSPPPT